jgi:glycosyltransferase involved in cell wall biosynthesis
MNKASLISVIIPFYNTGPWLGEAIESVLHQTYTNWEIILVDDGSLKEDTAIAKFYALKLPKCIFYVQHEDHANRGVTASRNVGIQQARGELIAFLDADDFWLPEKLQHQLNIFDHFPEISMICEASCFWYDWQDAQAKNELIEIGVRQGVYRPPELMKQLYPLGAGQPPCPSGIIIKCEALERSGGFEETFSGIYQLYEDQAFLSKVYSKEIIYISAIANNLYRKRPDSLTSAADNAALYKDVRFFYLDFLEQYFLRSTNENPEIKKLLKDFKTTLNSS